MQPTPRPHAHARRGGIYKKAMLWIAAILALGIVLLALEFYAGASARPIVTDRYSAELERLSLARQAEHAGTTPNAHDEFAAVIMEAKAANDALFDAWMARSAESDADSNDPWDYASIEALYVVPDEGTPEQVERARQRGLQDLRDWESRGVFDRASSLPTLGPVARPPTDNVIEDLMMPYAGATRALARAQAARGRVAAQGGDHATLGRATDETLALGRHMGNLGYLIDWLVGVSIQEQARSAMLDSLLLHPATDPATLDNLDAAIERELQQRMPTLADAIRGERLFALDSFQHFFTDNGNGGGRFLPLQYTRLMDSDFFEVEPTLTPFGDRNLSNIHGRLYLGRRATTKWFDGMFERMIAAADASSADAPALDAEVSRYFDTADWRNPVAQGSSFQFATARLVERRRRIQAAGTRVLLAVERYRLRHDGAIPQTLEDLGDLLPETLRTDPFTGEPWDYQPTPITTRANGEPLEPNDTVWPYTLASRPLPGTPAPEGPSEHDPYEGILITTPVEGNSFDEPYTEADDEN